MKKEYIERNVLLQHKRKMRGFDLNEEFWDEAVLCEEIKQIPAADVAPVVHGEWKRYRDKWCCSYVCSVCEKPAIYGISYEPRLSNYCPNCGAKMDGGNINER